MSKAISEYIQQLHTVSNSDIIHVLEEVIAKIKQYPDIRADLVTITQSPNRNSGFMHTMGFKLKVHNEDVSTEFAVDLKWGS